MDIILDRHQGNKTPQIALKKGGFCIIMKNMVVIDMQNPNALIAMAHVSFNANDPYAVFAEYFKYCIFSSAKSTMMLQEIITAVGEEFGLYVPQHIALKCVSQLKREGAVSLDGHTIRRVGFFDTEAFNERRDKYRETETALIDALIKYAATYNRDWTAEYAREQLINVLDRDGLAHDIFLYGTTASLTGVSGTDIFDDEIAASDSDKDDVDVDIDQPLFRDSLFVGKFVQSLLGSGTIEEEYLKRICEGLMVCVGAYQLPSNESAVMHPPINGTAFFFDTRLLLRIMGCAGEAAVTATKELVDLIQGNGGLIYYYPHTQEEIDRAFSDAIYQLTNGYVPKDHEMRLYARKIGNNVAIMTAKKASFQEELARLNIHLRQTDNHSDSERIRFGFDCDDLCKYMCEHLSWDSRTIENDAHSIWETHMRRSGDYSEYCGTTQKLCVFVTSNSRLIEMALGFRAARPNTSSVQMWKRNRLPVITDFKLTCRLWSPAEQGERLSLLYLTANAVAAQHPTQKYFNSVRKLAGELGEQVPEYAGISLPAYFDDNVTDAIIKSTKGQEENLNIGIFASSIAELAEWKAKEQEEITNKAITERDQISGDFNAQTQAIIDGAVEKVKNKMGLPGCVLRMASWSPILMAALISIVSALVSLAIDKWRIFFVAVVFAVLGVVEQITSSLFFKKWVLRLVLPWVEKKYELRIKKQLRKAEEPYQETIIKQAHEQTKLLASCKKLLGLDE